MAAAVPRKAADGRGRRRETDKRAVEGASPYGADGHFPPCHCEPVTDVTGVAIRFLRSRRGGACPSRKHRRGTDKRAVEGASPYGTDPPFPRRGRRPRRPALPPPPGEVAATVPRKAADGRGRRRGTDIRAVEGASPYGADRRLPVGGDSRIARGHRRMTHIRAGTSPAPTAQTPVPRRGRRPAHGRPRLASPSGGGVSGV